MNMTIGMGVYISISTQAFVISILEMAWHWTTRF